MNEQNIWNETNTTEEKPAHRQLFGRKSILWLLFLLLVLITGGVLWFWGQKGRQSDQGLISLPIITSSEKPVRTEPQNPGGLSVPNRDKLVYNRLLGQKEGEEEQVEYLLPSPEQPRPMLVPSEESPSFREDLFEENTKSDDWQNAILLNQSIKPEAGSIPELPPDFQDQDLNLLTEEKEPPRQEEPDAQETGLSPSEEFPLMDIPRESVVSPDTSGKDSNTYNRIFDEIEESLKQEPLPKNKTSPLPSPSSAKRFAGAYTVQLVSVRSRKEAYNALNKLKPLYPQVFNGRTAYMEPVTLKGRGIFYRLKIGPLADITEARKLCENLWKDKRDCLVVGKQK